MRHALWKGILKLRTSTDDVEFYEWVKVGIDVYTSHHKYQFKSHSSPRFSAAYAIVIEILLSFVLKE